MKRKIVDYKKADKVIEAIRRACQCCRTCNHERMLHLDTGCIYVTKLWERCNCKEFVPLDNLDYVEWLVKKRKLV